MSSGEHILFLTCMPLESPRSASMAFMGILLEKYSDSFCWFSLRPSKTDDSNPFDIPSNTAQSFDRFARFPHMKQFLKLFIWSRLLSKRAADFGRAHNAQLVLADLAFEAATTGRLTAKSLRVPLFAMVHDDPVNRIRVKNYPSWMLRLYEREFARTLREARRCAVISDYMGEIYQERYGVKTITLFPGVDHDKCLPAKVFDPQKVPIVIGSVGSINSKKNWAILLEAVRLLNERHGEGKFRALHLGMVPNDLPISKDAEVTGWLPEDDFIIQLGRMDIGFLNWDFASEYAVTRRTSFPLKTSSYIQAQVPIIALGPQDSTVIRFINDYHCGLSCTVQDAKMLAKKLDRFVFGENNFAEALEGIKALKEIFNREIFFKRFEKFLQ